MENDVHPPVRRLVFIIATVGFRVVGAQNKAGGICPPARAS